MYKIFIFIAALVFLASCKKEIEPVQQSSSKLSYVFKVLKQKSSIPLNIYYFYINNAVDTARDKEFTVDLDSNNIATFTLPFGVSAVQKTKRQYNS